MFKKVDRKKLYDLVWQKPMVEVSKQFGLSDRGLAKLCERNSIPVPPRGYWARKAAGQKIKRPPLLELERNIGQEIRIQGAPKQASAEMPYPELQKELKQLLAREDLQENRIVVPERLFRLHPIVVRWMREKFPFHTEQKGMWPISLKETPEQRELNQRRFRIVDALNKALEKRGMAVSEIRDGSCHIEIASGQEKVAVRINERRRKAKRKLEEKERHSWSDRDWAQVLVPTGRLYLQIGSPYGCVHKEIEETEANPLELRLNEGMKVIFEYLWEEKRRTLERREDERRRASAEAERQRQEKLRQEELARQRALERDAENWIKAGNLRGYIRAREAAFQRGELKEAREVFMSWKIWAMGHADVLDPLDKVGSI